MSAQEERLLSPEEVKSHGEAIGRLADGLWRVLLGQEDVIDTTLWCLLARGNLLLEGLPGLGKTELVKGLGRLLDLEFSRIQFTPDLLPADITGSHILEQKSDGSRELVWRRVAVFANLVLADEINRASPKTQAALLEAMQEHNVTVLGTTHRLPEPFFVLATQNPIELEGTYPLPEAQLDRFLFKVNVGAVGPGVLCRILETRKRGEPPALESLMDAAGLRALFDAVDRVHLPKAVAEYIARLVAATDPTRPESPAAVKSFVRYGVSPRAAIAIASAGRACALASAKPSVGFDDVRRVAAPVLRHRLLLSYQAGLEGVDAEGVIASLLDAVHELSRVPEEVDG